MLSYVKRAYPSRCYNAFGMDLLRRVADFIARERLLRPGQRVVAAVSGGADSLCLLDCLARLGYAVVVAHLDHQLRPESRDEAAYTMEIARRYGLPAAAAREDVRSQTGRGVSLEQAARIARYRFLIRVAREHRASVIATGHTADDQAETILMHFLRGAGPEGLRGMLPSASLEEWPDLAGTRGLRLIRPLLAVTREETMAHCAHRNLTPRHDPSNLDPVFLRNRLRHELLPILASYNPEIRAVLCRTGRLMASVTDLLNSLADQAWQSVVREVGPGAVALETGRLHDLPHGLQLALMRRVLRTLSPRGRRLSMEVIERALERVLSPPRSSRAEVGSGLELWRVGKEIVIASPGASVSLPEFPQLASLKPRRLSVPGVASLACGWKLEARYGPDGARVPLSDLECVAFDADLLAGVLRLRSPSPGDRIEPMGMQGSRKLSDLFIDLHVPRLARARWPVLVAGEKTLWLVGLRRSRHAPVTRRTRRRLVLRLIAPDER